MTREELSNWQYGPLTRGQEVWLYCSHDLPPFRGEVLSADALVANVAVGEEVYYPNRWCLFPTREEAVKWFGKSADKSAGKSGDQKLSKQYILILRFPPGKSVDQDGRDLDNGDLAISILQRLELGGDVHLSLPSTRDSEGRYLWDLQITELPERFQVKALGSARQTDGKIV